RPAEAGRVGHRGRRVPPVLRGIPGRMTSKPGALKAEPLGPGTLEAEPLEPGPLGLGTRSTGSGPTVLWIHGYTLDSSLWADLWQRLPGYRHIGVDLPGHGSSGPVPAGLTLPALAQ